jgi:saccharopine dehydrogenase-like NADP-dependent oxidoreductase
MNMKKILVIGAGRSSANLIKYLIEHADQEKWMIRVGDMDPELAKEKTNGSAFAETFKLDASNPELRRKEISEADLVISMLPASMHMTVAADCIDFRKNLITPSYIPDEMWSLDSKAKEKGVLILNEMGVDPGIDHMSAMKIIHELEAKGVDLESFESFTGGLIAPQSDDNPWNYKITWNPRNVVLAGYGGTARFQQDGELKYIPYHKLFQRTLDVHIEGHGHFDGYANRDSLKYKKIYGLENIPTLYRGTLRKSGFCKAWDCLVQLGLTDDSFQIEHPETLTWRKLTTSFLNIQGFSSVEEAAMDYLKTDEASFNKLIWLGIFENKSLNISVGSPAVALQKLIEEKWQLGEDDKDMIVMWHRFRFTHNGKRKEIQSSMISLGDDQIHTAMSKTVGLPIGIAARMLLNGKISLTGIHLPILPSLYNPILDELKTYQIQFHEIEKDC